MPSFVISLNCQDEESFQTFDCDDFHSAVEIGLTFAKAMGSRLREIDILLDLPVLDGTPKIGIFWRVQPADGDVALLVDCVPLEKAETYGEFLTYGAHFEFWNKHSVMGSSELKSRLIPDVVRWTEYEEWPRGRIVFHQPSGRFTIYADRKLQTSEVIAEILHRFSLPADCTNVRSDSHYVSNR